MSPFMDHRSDKITYVLCIFKHTLLGGCQKGSMIKLSNVCPCVLKSVKQKVEANGNSYLLIMNVLKVFDSNM
jgi:hypothetical protein